MNTLLLLVAFAISDNLTGQLWNCHIAEKQLKHLQTDAYDMNGRDTVIYRLSRRWTDVQDTILIYETNHRKPMPFPHYYVYDMDYDGRPDMAYEDMQGNGICSQMREVSVTHALGQDEKGA